jgi:hypothetical protein
MRHDMPRRRYPDGETTFIPRAGALSAFLLPAVTLLAAASAQANIAAVQRNPGTLGGARTLGATSLIVERERLVFDCAEAGEGVHCTFAAEYTVRHPGEVDESVVAAFLGIATEGVTIQVDGQMVSRELSDEEATALQDAVLAGRDEAPLSEEVRERTRLYGFGFDAAPGSQHEIAARGTIGAGARFVPEAWYPAVGTRHLLTSYEVGGRAEAFHDLRYLLAPLDTWAETHELEIVIRCPADWRIDGLFGEAREDYGGLPEGLSGEWEPAVEGDIRTATYRGTGRVEPVLEIGFAVPAAEPFWLGGPVIGLGGTVGDGGGSFWMRWGYEVAWPDWMLYSINVDTDYSDRAVLALQIEGATPLPSMPIIPSFDVGVGLPIQLLPEVQVGVRLLCGFSWGPIGFNATFDFYPGLDTGHPDFLQIGLMGLILV